MNSIFDLPENIKTLLVENKLAEIKFSVEDLVRISVIIKEQKESANKIATLQEKVSQLTDELNLLRESRMKLYNEKEELEKKLRKIHEEYKLKLSNLANIIKSEMDKK